MGNTPKLRLAAGGWELIASSHTMARRLLKQLIAIIIGNLIYFFLLMPHLPARAQHRPDKLDLGLLVDFWICVVVYGIIELISRRASKRGS